MNRETAWAAGLFEGEGCISLGKHTGGDVRAILASTDRDVVDRFARIAGCGLVKPRPYPGALKDQWVWTAHGEDAVRVLSVFLPMLGERRRAKAEDLIAKRAARVEHLTQERPCSICGVLFRPLPGMGSWRRRRCDVHCAPVQRRLRKMNRGAAMERVRDLSWEAKA